MAQDLSTGFAGPLHEQVQDILRTRIRAGEWRDNEPLPGEADLSRQLGVSVGTVRKAMDSLARENIIVRERGRGTFIKQAADWRSNGTFRLLAAGGLPVRPDINLTEIGAALATPAERQDFQLQARVGMGMRLLRLNREWRAAGVLVCREMIMIEEARFPGLDSAARAAGDTLFEIYAKRYRVKVDLLRWRIGAATTDFTGFQLGEDGLQPPVLVVHRTALDARGMPIELCRQLVSLANREIEIMR